MPWHWSDDLAYVLLDAGKIDDKSADRLIAIPVAYRSDVETIEEAACELAEEGEIPLAA